MINKKNCWLEQWKKPAPQQEYKCKQGSKFIKNTKLWKMIGTPIGKRNLREGRKHPAVQGGLLLKPNRIPLPVIWRFIEQGGQVRFGAHNPVTDCSREWRGLVVEIHRQTSSLVDERILLCFVLSNCLVVNMELLGARLHKRTGIYGWRF
jgi:hypothetical protein